MKLRILMCLIIVPLLGLASYFAGQIVRTDHAAADRAEMVAALAVEQVLINDLIHELQKERGYSAGHIASGGENFTFELNTQRTETSVRVDLALTATALVAAQRPAAFQAARTDLDQLDTMRSRVTAGQIDVPGMARFYTGIINNLIETAYPPQVAEGGASLESLQSMRALLTAAKERAGLERAMGSAGLGATFSASVYRRYLNLAGAQQALLSQIGQEPGGLEILERLYNSTEFATLQRTRDDIVSAVASGAQPPIMASEWFKLSTVWIDLLRDAEIEMSQEIHRVATALEAKSTENHRHAIILGAVSILLVGLIAIYSFERIIRRIKSLTEVVYGFAKGDFGIFVPDIDGKDELSRMARAIYHFKQETLSMRREAEEMKQADEAELNAKHGKVVELVTEGLAALAKADITCQFDQPLDGEYDSIRIDFNSASERLRTVLSSISATVSELDQASATMKRSALDLASRTTEQVETIRDTTTKVSALSTEVEEFGQDIAAATAMASTAREQAAKSASLMREAVEAMNKIRASSEQIGDIIVMIEDIAFQTNLLALNAGVEAARAGEAGRGFAVVASEVRALAKRASDATQEIKRLVEQSGANVKEGGDLVDDTGAALDEISEEIMHVDDVLLRVSSGSRLQIEGLRSLDAAMTVISDLASKNTSMADDTRSSAEDIAQRSGGLASLVDDFKLAPDQALPGPSNRAA